jgi:hypothetical protein
MKAIQIKQILDKMLINHSKNFLNKSTSHKRKKIKKAVNKAKTIRIVMKIEISPKRKVAVMIKLSMI